MCNQRNWPSDEQSELVGRELLGLEGPFEGEWTWYHRGGCAYTFLPGCTAGEDPFRIMDAMVARGYAVYVQTITRKKAPMYSVEFLRGEKSGAAVDRELPFAIVKAAAAALSATKRAA